MKNRIKKTARIVGLILAVVLLLNTFYASEVSAAESRTIMTIYPELTTSDGRVTVTVCITYQESTGIFTGASVQRIGATTDVSNLVVETPVLSADKKTVTVTVGYNYTSWGTTYYAIERLQKKAP